MGGVVDAREDMQLLLVKVLQISLTETVKRVEKRETVRKEKT